MISKSIIAVGAVLVLLTTSPEILSHCEIPCGIYDDDMRIHMMEEHIATIEKSIKQIHELQQAPEVNLNQVIRWTVNKEKHADQLSDIVTQYFMKQRVKPADSSDEKAYDTYISRLTSLHKIMIYSMKCKQGTDLDNVDKLKENLAKFKSVY